MDHKEQETSHFRAQRQTQGPAAADTEQSRRERSHLLAFPFQDRLPPAASVPPVLRYFHPFLHWNANCSADRRREMRLATRTDALWTTNTLKLVTGMLSLWFHKQWTGKHWWCLSHTRASTLVKVDKKGTLSRVGAYQQRKPPLMITSVQPLNLIKTWSSILNATQVQTKRNQNKMTRKETTRTTRETGHHSSNRD